MPHTVLEDPTETVLGASCDTPNPTNQIVRNQELLHTITIQMMRASQTCTRPKTSLWISRARSELALVTASLSGEFRAASSDYHPQHLTVERGGGGDLQLLDHLIRPFQPEPDCAQIRSLAAERRGQHRSFFNCFSSFSTSTARSRVDSPRAASHCARSCSSSSSIASAPSNKESRVAMKSSKRPFNSSLMSCQHRLPHPVIDHSTTHRPERPGLLDEPLAPLLKLILSVQSGVPILYGGCASVCCCPLPPSSSGCCFHCRYLIAVRANARHRQAALDHLVSLFPQESTADKAELLRVGDKDGVRAAVLLETSTEYWLGWPTSDSSVRSTSRPGW